MPRTSLYSEFEDGVKAMIGIETLIEAEKTLLNQYFNRWIRFCHEFYPFPEIVKTELRTVDANNVIGWEQSGKDAIGMFYNIYKTDPFASAYPEELSFTLTDDGARIISSSDLTGGVYPRYQKRVSTYTTDRTQTFPYIFLPSLQHFSYGDWLKSDGQNQKGIAEHTIAEEILKQEIEKFERQQFNEQPTRFNTYISTSFRY